MKISDLTGKRTLDNLGGGNILRSLDPNEEDKVKRTLNNLRGGNILRYIDTYEKTYIFMTEGELNR